MRNLISQGERIGPSRPCENENKRVVSPNTQALSHSRSRLYSPANRFYQTLVNVCMSSVVLNHPDILTLD